MSDYDEQYGLVENVFGETHESILERFVGQLPDAATVLDIGAGQGRNALFLARSGCTVHALEPSKVGAEQLRARSAGLPLEVFDVGFHEFEPPVRFYDGICIFGLIPDLPWTAIRQLVVRLDSWSMEETLLWITGFTTEDPAHAKHVASWKRLEQESFEATDGRVRTYLLPGQVLELLPRFAAVHHHEGLGPEHDHGDGNMHRHAKFEAVLRR